MTLFKSLIIVLIFFIYLYFWAIIIMTSLSSPPLPLSALDSLGFLFALPLNSSALISPNTPH